MRFITFLACLMMGLSIWSVTTHAQENPQPPAVNKPAQTTFGKSTVCQECINKLHDSTGCETGFNAPSCVKKYEGAPTTNTTTPAAGHPIVE